MKIGLDFDNTIVCYDTLFHKVAIEKALIPSELPRNKIAVRDYLKKIDKEKVWTELQGYVYGERMNEATPYPGMVDALISLKKQGHELIIVSHKTQFPYEGIQYDMHESANKWILDKLNNLDFELIKHKNVFFNKTKSEKILKIKNLECNIFLDDLPEILLAEDFPESTKRCLFDPGRNYRELDGDTINVLHSWDSFSNWVLSDGCK
jgi:hypothetical protein